MDGVADTLPFVVGDKLVGVDGLAGRVAVTTGGGARDVDGRRPATDEDGDAPGRSDRVGMTPGGASGAELAGVVVVTAG